jgi:hypothetical protein
MYDDLKEYFPNIEIKNNKTIDGGCSKKRPDVMIDCLTHTIIIECDENQHQYDNYSCENKRTMELFTDLGNRPMVMIRFNPDEYKIGTKKVQSCFKGEAVNSYEWKKRINSLNKLSYKEYTF